MYIRGKILKNYLDNNWDNEILQLDSLWTIVFFLNMDIHESTN